MRHYLAIFVQSDVDEWRVVFPDVPACEAHGFTLDDARFSAVTALKRCLEENHLLPPTPMDLSAVERSEEWLKRNHVDLSRAVISMIPPAA
jgi:predicted RNase H-like HicB family nuclease